MFGSILLKHLKIATEKVNLELIMRMYTDQVVQKCEALLLVKYRGIIVGSKRPPSRLLGKSDHKGG